MRKFALTESLLISSSLSVNEFSHVGLIGGGSGITPLYQVLTSALRDPNNTTKFTLLFGNASEKDILLKEELDRLKKKYPRNFDVVYFVDKSDGSGIATEGYMTKDGIAKYFDPSLGERIKIFVCGGFLPLSTNCLSAYSVSRRSPSSNESNQWPEERVQSGRAWWRTEGAWFHGGSSTSQPVSTHCRLTILAQVYKF
jgi:NAD(P)H-flavin reductase